MGAVEYKIRNFVEFCHEFSRSPFPEFNAVFSAKISELIADIKSGKLRQLQKGICVEFKSKAVKKIPNNIANFLAYTAIIINVDGVALEATTNINDDTFTFTASPRK